MHASGYIDERLLVITQCGDGGGPDRERRRLGGCAAVEQIPRADLTGAIIDSTLMFVRSYILRSVFEEALQRIWSDDCESLDSTFVKSGAACEPTGGQRVLHSSVSPQTICPQARCGRPVSPHQLDSPQSARNLSLLVMRGSTKLRHALQTTCSGCVLRDCLCLQSGDGRRRGRQPRGGDDRRFFRRPCGRR